MATVLSQPGARGLSRRSCETFEGAQEDLLGDVLGFGGVGHQAHGGAKNHILVVSHERFELLGVCHGRRSTVENAHYAQPAGEGKTDSTFIDKRIIHSG